MLLYNLHLNIKYRVVFLCRNPNKIWFKHTPLSRAVDSSVRKYHAPSDLNHKSLRSRARSINKRSWTTWRLELLDNPSLSSVFEFGLVLLFKVSSEKELN